MANTVLRITRHPHDADREYDLRRLFGADAQIVDRDVPYGDDPVPAVRDLIAQVAAETGSPVVAVEAIAPFGVLTRLVAAQRELDVTFIRAKFARGEGGRALVVGRDEAGRDALAFAGYEAIVKIEFVVRDLDAPPSAPEDDLERQLEEARDRAYTALAALAALEPRAVDDLYQNTSW